MKTVIYLDELLLTNFLAAAMLLLCTGLLCARQCSGLRLLAGSAAAAAFSLGILLPELPGAAAVLCKVFTCGAVVAAAYGLPGLRSFARLCGWYAALNGLLCGAVVEPDDPIYSIEPTEEALAACMRRSTFQTKLDLPGEEARLVTLSTCSYEFNNARFVLLGVMFYFGMTQLRQASGDKG